MGSRYIYIYILEVKLEIKPPRSMSALAASKPNSPPPITAALRHFGARARIASMSSIVP